MLALLLALRLAVRTVVLMTARLGPGAQLTVVLRLLVELRRSRHGGIPRSGIPLAVGAGRLVVDMAMDLTPPADTMVDLGKCYRKVTYSLSNILIEHISLLPTARLVAICRWITDTVRAKAAATVQAATAARQVEDMVLHNKEAHPMVVSSSNKTTAPNGQHTTPRRVKQAMVLLPVLVPLALALEVLRRELNRIIAKSGRSTTVSRPPLVRAVHRQRDTEAFRLYCCRKRCSCVWRYGVSTRFVA